MVGEECRRVARQVLSPPAPLVLFPIGFLFGLASVGMLPPTIRDGLGLAWDRRADRALAAMSFAVRRTVPLLPARVRRWLHALEAERRMRAARAPIA